MAKVKEIALSKRLKISQAQQYMILSVLGAAIFLGVAISLVSFFIRQISFNTKVIMEEEATIASYSEIIKSIGICKAPSGAVYSSDELKKCDPDSIEAKEIPGTLRAAILEDVAANPALNSVPKDSNASCKDPETGAQYTYKDLKKIYEEARGSDELIAASQLIRSCSALRVIPDALPSFKNEEALLASLNKLFKISNWEPESLSPTGTTSVSSLGNGLNTISVNLSVEAASDTTFNILKNIERSIREFNINNATIEWGSENALELKANATAYYMDESGIVESTKNMKEGN